MTLQVLTEFKTVFKEDVDLELNVAKTVILPGFALDSFSPEGFVSIGVSIGTDTFVRIL